jgi:hypothetical protein
MDALLFALDWLVRELECYYLLKRANSVCNEIDYLDTVAFLDEIRQSPEYHNLR